MDIKYIFGKMEEYSDISSLTGNEKAFTAYLKNDLKNLEKYEIESKTDCFLVKSKVGSPYTLLVHIDRISVGAFKYEFSEIIKGQTNNVISIAIMRYLFEQGVNLNALFTTREENCSNANQIISYTEEFPGQVLIDLDIDVAVSREEVVSGAVSIRKNDSLMPYSVSLVKYIEELCEKNKINYINKDGDWLIVQIGIAMAKYKELKGLTNKALSELRRYGYIGIPIWNYHSNHEEASAKSVLSVVKLLKKLAENSSLAEGEYNER